MGPLLLILLGMLSLSFPVSASFAVYYGPFGPDETAQLDKFNILILPPTIDPTYVSCLSANHTVAGYVSLSTVGGWEPWAEDVPQWLFIDKNKNWNEEVVDFASPEWERIILDEAVPYILSRGFNGVFLDNLDYVDLYPSKRAAVVELVKAIRERYPNITIIANRGFSIAKEIAPYVDYVLFEDFVSYYNFTSGRYEIFGENELEWEFGHIEKLKGLNVSVLALSYANLSDESQVEEFPALICEYAKEWRIKDVYLTDVALQRIGVDPCVEASNQSPAGTTTTTSYREYNKDTLTPSGESSPKSSPKEATENGENGSEPRVICGPALIVTLLLLALTSRWRRF
ncbi:endo alpha-1,4 polygalactosaminidase [Thermococcus piezophilus]|uniref:Glycoside-hydrolase family GH114 TIM-barrel domain-containing protein n=1 Tax=Thermococcus piezophilus TaxID=1712654 RepID=A0A172WIR5_9EURY|nr:endo alpha-1,4 polygalactosaminidase [Thermococcus piezophilus]ANF23354.1 hypothetical protein A7C91_09355 [Thermococcus piezophilus]